MLSKNQIKEIQSLHLKKYRDLKGLYIAEGVKTVIEMLRTHAHLVQSVYLTSAFISNHPELVAKVASVTEVSDDELSKISLQQSPNEALAVCFRFRPANPSFDAKKQAAFYLDDIRDPGNLGTIMRLADWFGMPAVFCSPSTCELYNPKVIQSSMGAFLRVPCMYADLGEVIERYSPANVYGALLHGKDLYAATLAPGLIVIGNEANGIRKEYLPHITTPLTIPAAASNGTESLNAAMAAAVMAGEFFRQLR